MESSHPVLSANVDVLVVNDSNEATHDAGNEKDVKSEKVVMTGRHHDHENETLLRIARQGGQANVLSPGTERPMETGSVVKKYDASAVSHA